MRNSFWHPVRIMCVACTTIFRFLFAGKFWKLHLIIDILPLCRLTAGGKKALLLLCRRLCGEHATVSDQLWFSSLTGCNRICLQKLHYTNILCIWKRGVSVLRNSWKCQFLQNEMITRNWLNFDLNCKPNITTSKLECKMSGRHAGTPSP